MTRSAIFRAPGWAPMLFLISAGALAAEIRPGEKWLDTDGNPIQAHGGGILAKDGIYYWYGEDRSQRRMTTVSCYASTDLVSWKHEGVVFSPDAFPDEYRRNFIERPKVIFNPGTGQYVLWFHMEGRGYHFARGGIATSDRAAGPFEFHSAIRPITQNFDFPDDRNEQQQFGGTLRDMNLLVDDDGRAYVFYASENNATLYIVRLNDEFTGPQTPAVEGETWARVLVGKMREAPAPFKYAGRFYLITSGCTGWTPNAAEYAVADNVLGPWQSLGNPCVGDGAKRTFESQSTFVLPIAGRPARFLFMADRWRPRQLADSRYIWLPFVVGADDKISIPWRDAWEMTAFETADSSRGS